MNFTTKLLSDLSSGALRTPIYANAAFAYDSSQELEAVFGGKQSGHLYTRSSNPSVEALESKIQNAIDAAGVVGLSSGMAAITATFFALLQSGDNIITTDKLFGHTLSFLRTTLRDFDVEVRYVDINDIDAIEKNIDADTKMVFCESMSNPGLIIPDFKAIASVCKAHGIVFAVDTTLTPWTMFDAKSFGVDIEIVSATKFLSGGGTVLGGLIVDTGNYEWKRFSHLRPFYEKFANGAFIKKLKKQTVRNFGAVLSPFHAYLIDLGIETLQLRVNKANKNAKKTAAFLRQHPKVSRVRYGGLKQDPFYQLAKKQFNGGGSIVVFDVGSKKNAYKVMDKFKIIKRCTNIQDNKTLAIAPYDTIYAEYDDTLKAKLGLRRGSVRLSLGIEKASDIIKDLNQALGVLE
jgi:O-acetylhomoserine (thiol)-lyase